MKAPSVILRAPPEVTIFRGFGSDTRDPSVRGRITCRNFSNKDNISVHAQVRLVRSGTFHIARPVSNESSPWYKPRRRQSRSREADIDLQHVETLVECSIEMKLDRSGDLTSAFELVIPSYLCPTTKLPSVEVCYAVEGQLILPSGQSLSTHQSIRLSKRWLIKPRLLPSPGITFPESPLVVQVSFAKQDAIKGRLPITVLLRGLEPPRHATSSVASVSWVRESEITKMTPRTIRWELEEKVIVMSAQSVDDTMVSTLDAERYEEARVIAKGKYQPVLHPPFTPRPNAMVESELEIEFNAHLPKGIEIPFADELMIFDDRLTHTIPCSTPAFPSPPQSEQNTRFAVHVEHSFRVCVHMGEDTFHKATGSLVNRKYAQFAYTVVVPLKNTLGLSTHRDCESDTDLPTYQVAVGMPPTYSLTKAA
ncbi:hypothetical protein FB567DRAFT_592295 [Paraphoma chrysanthemicola]|uniref:Uncharacterized protein n=1 Tax=Paraphoma chrysanthemicola TaxID=798071 RepID=A0A8K0R6L8_9PLEO|nr:hypothetical protein FB567DRAFT_592295 [Paraphoma chrysanthemicola]